MNEPSEHVVSDDVKEVVEQYAADEMVNDIMMGHVPAADPSENWDEETKAKVKAIFAALEPKPEEPTYDLRQHFRAGERIKDHGQGLIMVIHSVGSAAMTVGVLGKKVRWKVGSTVAMGGQAFVVLRARKNEAILERMGPAIPGYMKDTTDKEAPNGQT